jgi:hypothetical protein
LSWLSLKFSIGIDQVGFSPAINRHCFKQIDGLIAQMVERLRT